MARFAWAIALGVGIALLMMSGFIELTYGLDMSVNGPVSQTVNDGGNSTYYKSDLHPAYQAFSWGAAGFALILVSIVIRWSNEAYDDHRQEGTHKEA